MSKQSSCAGSVIRQLISKYSTYYYSIVVVAPFTLCSREYIKHFSKQNKSANKLYAYFICSSVSGPLPLIDTFGRETEPENDDKYANILAESNVDKRSTRFVLCLSLSHSLSLVLSRYTHPVKRHVSWGEFLLSVPAVVGAGFHCDFSPRRGNTAT